MSISKKNLTKLGLGGFLKANEEALFVNDEKTNHRRMSDVEIDIVNKGTLRKEIPSLVIKKNIYSKENFQTYMLTDLINQDNKTFFSEYTVEQIPFGQLSYFNTDKIYYHFSNNNYFIPFAQEKQNNMVFGTDNSLNYVRLSYPSIQNNSIITGKRNTKDGLQNIIYNGNNISFTGSRSISVNRQFKIWESSNTAGINNSNYSNYYIPYPITLQSYNYNAYNVPVKIAPFFNNLSYSGQDLNGLILVTTGNNLGSKICYISPHGLSSGNKNTIVYGQALVKNTLTSGLQNKKIATGIIASCLTLGSEYFSGNVLPSTGITYNSNISTGEYIKASVTGITGFVNTLKLENDQIIKQTSPIKDTLFYKFYSGIYNGSKTFNTGTWDGIIPSGVQFSIELVSTELNKEIGTINPLYVVYSGFGTNDTYDALITKYMTQNNLISGFFYNTNIPVTDKNTIKSIGRAYGINTQESLLNSLIHSRYLIATKLGNLIKKFVPAIVKENRKLRKLRAFLNR